MSPCIPLLRKQLNRIHFHCAPKVLSVLVGLKVKIKPNAYLATS